MNQGGMFITGGSRGIGAGVGAVAAARHGYDVAFTYRERRDAAEALRATVGAESPEARCEAYQLDVRDSAAVERVGDQVLDAFDTVHVVVANAAVTHAGMAIATADEDWSAVLDTNLTGSYSWRASSCRRFSRMASAVSCSCRRSRRRACPATWPTAPARPACSASRPALAKEYGRKGITSNALLMSLFETEMTLKELSAKNRDFYEAHCPAGRIGQVGEVGPPCCSSPARARRSSTARKSALPADWTGCTSDGHRDREARRLSLCPPAGHRHCATRAAWMPPTSAAACSATSAR